MRIQVDLEQKEIFTDDRSPFFMWKYISGEVQIAFEISVEEKFSGYIEGSNTHYSFDKPIFDRQCSNYIVLLKIYYLSGKCYTYKRKVRTGLMGEPRQAKWIWYENKVINGDFSIFRKFFSIIKEVDKAYIHVSSHNYHTLEVNGHRVGGYLSPAPSDPEKCKYYLMYDIIDLVKKGENTINAICHYIGGSGQNYVNGMPGFLLYLTVEYTDGTKQDIYTDSTWEAAYEVPYDKSTDFMQQRRISVIERYDARKESLFQPACEVNRNYNIVLQEIPEEVVSTVISPRIVSKMSGVTIYDVGRIVTGFPRIKLNSKLGHTIRIRYSEDLDENGRVKHNVCNEFSDTYYDEYISSGEGDEVFMPEFSIKAFRYIDIEGNINELDILWVYTGILQKGSLNSSDETLNSIFRAAMNTQKNALHGQVTDCPHREQAQYLADAQLQSVTLLYNFDTYSVLDKVLNDFKNGQLEKGTFPVVFPTNIGSDIMGDLHIPEWDLHFVMLIYDFYFHTGDGSIIDRYFNSAKRMIDYYISLIDDNGLVPKSDQWHISDWPYPKISHEYKYLTVQNCKLYHCMMLMGCYKKEAYALRAAIRKHLFIVGKGIFIDESQGVNVAALRYGLVDNEEIPGVINFILSKGHETSMLLSYDLLRILFENGNEEEAYKLLMKSWSYMIQMGYETLWEGFNNIESHSHAWSCYPIRIVQEFILGVKCVKAGFTEVIIDGYMPFELEYISGDVCTPKGIVNVKRRKNYLYIKLPSDMKVSVTTFNGIEEIYSKGEYEFFI